MLNINKMPYGALFNLEPGYLRCLNNDEVLPDQLDEFDEPESDDWHFIATMKALITGT